MADFNALLGNGNGCVAIFGSFQIDGELYASGYKTLLEESSDIDVASAKAQAANSQGVYENSSARRPFIEKRIKDFITKIEGVYTFRKRFFFNQTLTNQQVLDYLIADDMAGFLAHPDTLEMLTNNGGEKLIDAIIGGTVAP